MAPTRAPVLWGLAALAIGALFAIHDSVRPVPAPAGTTRSVQDTEDLLEGAWLREYTADGVKVRRVLTLAPDGRFREAVRAVDAHGGETHLVHEGTWLYDGTNLKRKYTLMNGRPPSRLNVPFATFEIAFETRNEFRGVDHIHRNRILYRRVNPDAQP
jgi:hypothetical protein